MSFKHHKLIAVAAAMTLAVAGCGSDESHDNHNASGTESSEQAGGGFDRAFAQAMIPHHESAIEMAEVAQDRGESRFVKQLADDIVGTQNAEIETLRAQDAELEEAGVEPGDLGMSHDQMGMDGDASMLEDAEPFDTTFIEMMIPHHEGAIAMARIELEKGADPDLKVLAEDIFDAQQREIDAMREHLGSAETHEGTNHGG